MTLSAYISHKKTQETFMGEKRKEEIIKKRQTKWKKKREAKGWRWEEEREGRRKMFENKSSWKTSWVSRSPELCVSKLLCKFIGSLLLKEKHWEDKKVGTDEMKFFIFFFIFHTPERVYKIFPWCREAILLANHQTTHSL